MPTSDGRYGLLLAMMEPGVITDEAIEAWYDHEHIPERLATPGFVTGQRFLNLSPAPRHLAIYDLDSPEVFQSKAYLALRENLSAETQRILADATSFRRGFYEQISPGNSAGPSEARGLLLLEFDCDAAAREPLEEAYGGFLRGCANIPGVLTARRFRALDENPQYLTLFHLQSPSVSERPEWEAALQSIRPYVRGESRNVYRSPS